MLDRELLELAAKAAGLEVKLTKGGGGWRNNGSKIWPKWNPLTDAADRQRLLIDLHMTLAFEPSRGGWSVGAIVNGEFAWLATDADAAQAIVRAAAEIGRAMP